MQADQPFSLVEVDKDGNPVEVLSQSRGGKCRFFTEEEITVLMNCNALTHWTFDFFRTHETPDPVPHELAMEGTPPMTMEERLRTFIGDMIAQRYGSSSEEFDTFEEAMDFDIEEEADPLTPYEENMLELIEEEPVDEPPRDQPNTPPAEEPPNAEAPQDEPSS